MRYYVKMGRNGYCIVPLPGIDVKASHVYMIIQDNTLKE